MGIDIGTQWPSTEAYLLSVYIADADLLTLTSGNHVRAVSVARGDYFRFSGRTPELVCVTMLFLQSQMH